jgi:hypothetical protein
MKPSLPSLLNRRHFLSRSGMGVGSIALACLLRQENLLAESKMVDLEKRSFDLLPKKPHFAPRAKAMISLFMQGGPSHMDLFDPKPELDRLNGQKFPGEVKYDDAAHASTKVLASPWKFKKHGQCGTDVSELLPHFAEIVDDVALIRSMHTGVNNHGQSIFALQAGRTTAGRPVIGSWLTYALGSESRNLPAFVALTDPRGLPVLGVDNWSNGWLPSLFQGTAVRAREPRILNLDAPAHLRGEAQKNYLDYLGELNRDHLYQHPGELDLEARIASFELAAKMQTAAKEAMDISGESDATKKLYGVDETETKDFGTRCLIARRLVERGVRFVQVYTGNQTWDHHKGIIASLPKACKYVDKPSAALVKDLKTLGLLDSTVVHWGGEMGRLPVVQYDTGRENVGRDHNTYGFSMWVAGGGFKAGLAYGETDEFGHKAVKDVVNHYDYHATLLNLFGLDPAKLVYKRNGVEQSLLDGQPGQVVKGLLKG